MTPQAVKRWQPGAPVTGTGGRFGFGNFANVFNSISCEIPKKDIHLGFVMLQAKMFLEIGQVVLMNSLNHYASLGSLSILSESALWLATEDFFRALLSIDHFHRDIFYRENKSQIEPAEIGSTGKQRPRIPSATAPLLLATWRLGHLRRGLQIPIFPMQQMMFAQ